MEYTNEHGSTPAVELQAQYDELNRAACAEIAAHATTAARCEELQSLLDNQKRATEVQERSAKNYATKADDLEAMLAPLVSYIGEALLESGGFQRQLQELVNDQVRDSFGDREFCDAVGDAVGNLSFEVNVIS